MVPQSDGGHTIGQIVSDIPEAMHSVLCTFSLRREFTPDLHNGLAHHELISVAFVMRDGLDSGSWKVVGRSNLTDVSGIVDLEARRKIGFIGTSIIDFGIVEDFLNACLGFTPWDCYARPDYFDDLVIDKSRKPPDLIFKDGAPRGEEASGILPDFPSMTVDEFMPWAADERETRYELVFGEVFAMASECPVHDRIRLDVLQTLENAIRERGLSYGVFSGTMAVQVSRSTVLRPDVSIRCGEPVDPETTMISDPIVVAEVVSPLTKKRDRNVKMAEYFRLQSTRHYLLIDSKSRTVEHHYLQDEGAIVTSVLRGGAVLRLEPPGIALALDAVFARA